MRAFIICALFVGAQAGTIKMKPATKAKQSTSDKVQNKNKTDKVGLKLKPKAASEGFVQVDNKARTTTTLAQTQKLLAQVFAPDASAVLRNQAARVYFRNVYYLPTTLQKMSATEAFIQSANAFQSAAGGQPGSVERLTPNELEHWLTTEFLPEELRESGNGLGYMYPEPILPPGLVSRGPEFAAHFKNKSACVGKHAREGMEDSRNLMGPTVNYGTHCGATNHGSQGCGSGARTTMRIENEDREVCADAGTDACCAHHDMIRTGIKVNALNTLSACKANKDIHSCLSNVEPDQVFHDKRDISERQANEAAKCVYQAMPCLAATKNKFYEINFKNEKGSVQSLYPTAAANHHQVVFPFDQSYGEDQMGDVYRKSSTGEFAFSSWKHIDPPAEVENNLENDAFGQGLDAQAMKDTRAFLDAIDPEHWGPHEGPTIVHGPGYGA